MVELAFSVLGERFEPPEEAAFWRVRRFKPSGRGTPEVVFSSEGGPLIVPLDMDLAEFRSVVGNVPGKYRLDPVDNEHRTIDGATAAYLQLSGQSAETADGARPEVRDDLIREIVRGYSDIVRNITDRFANVMDSAAHLLRAADGAGLPAREPRRNLPLLEAAPVERVEVEVEELEDDDEGSKLANVLEVAVNKAMPLLNHTINTKVLGLSPAQSLALLGADVPASLPAPEKPKEGKQATTGAAFISHLAAIEAELTEDESARVRAAIRGMNPGELAAWRMKIEAVPPKKAAALVRAELGERAA